MSVKKRIDLEVVIGGTTHTAQIDVTFRVLEIVESVFNMNADWVASRVLTSPQLLKYTKIAEVIADWVSPHIDERRGRIVEAVLAADRERMSSYVTAIQAACLFLRNHIDGVKFDDMMTPDDGAPDAADKGAKKKAKAKRKPRNSRKPKPAG